MKLPLVKEQPSNSGDATHRWLQTIATVVMALATVFAVVAQAKANQPLAWILGAMTILAGGFMFAPFVKRKMASVESTRIQRVRDAAAKIDHAELLQFAKRFGEFVNIGDSKHISHIIQNSCADDMEKAAAICPPDYMKDVFPIFLRNVETRPQENEAEFLLQIQELYALIASFTREYVQEPFQKMRSKKWKLENSSVLHTALGNTNPNDAKLGTWLISLPQHYQEAAIRQIEDFRERYASFQDAMREWLKGINEKYGTNLPTFFDRPQKL
jgi:hypothetical protein